MKRFTGWFTAVAILGAAAACSDTTAPELPSEASVEADGETEATVVATTGITDEQANGSSVLASVGSAEERKNHTDVRHEACAFDAASGRIVCRDVTVGGLTYSRSMAFYDAAGNAQPKRDTNTVKMNTRVAVKGTQTKERLVATIDRKSDFTVDGIQRGSARRTMSGVEEGTLKVVETTDRGVFTSVGTHADSTLDVVVAQTETAERTWPLSGSIVRVHSGTRSKEGSSESRTYSRREVIKFNGTILVPVTITVNGHTKTCEKNLGTGRLSCPETAAAP